MTLVKVSDPLLHLGTDITVGVQQTVEVCNNQGLDVEDIFALFSLGRILLSLTHRRLLSWTRSSLLLSHQIFTIQSFPLRPALKSIYP